MVLVLCSAAHAGFWERDLKVGYTVGVSLVAAFGRDDEADGGRRNATMGLAVNGQYQRFWADSPYYADGPVELPAPLVTVDARVGWTHPVVFSEVTLLAGPMQPLVVGDGGFQPLVATQGGIGLQLATDGSAAPLLAMSVTGAILEARIEAAIWRGDWHSPRFMMGPTLALNCCSYLL